jgi:hypothetical protein
MGMDMTGSTEFIGGGGNNCFVAEKKNHSCQNNPNDEEKLSVMSSILIHNQTG